MSVNTVEALLHELGNDPAMIDAFLADPAAVLDRYPLQAEERRYILEWDLHAMVDMGVSPMVLMFAYTSTHGGPIAARDAYIGILKSPRVPVTS